MPSPRKVSSKLLPPILTAEAEAQMLICRSVLGRAVKQAIRGGSNLTQRIQAADKRQLRYFQRALCTYGQRQRVRFRSMSDPNTLILYFTVAEAVDPTPSELARKLLRKKRIRRS